jgi:EmrB/QacA subfamily drug resistance transporter
MFGRRRMFLSGLLVFTAASLASGLAPTSAVLIGARVAQGVGASLMTPAALAILTSTYEGAQRATALSIWGAISSGAVAVGVIAGGALTSLLSWHWVFLINVPVGLVAVVAAARVLPRARPPVHTGSLDLPGAATAVGGFVTIVYALSGAPAHGWGSARTLALLGGGAGLLATFALIERRDRRPLVPPAIWRERALIAGSALVLGISAILVGAFFLISVYMQDVLRWSALHTGVSLLPFVATIAIGVHLTSRLVGKIGSRPLIIAGMGLVATAAVLFSVSPARGHYASDLLPALSVLGLGVGLAFPASSITAMSQVRDDISGLAAGISSTAHELGGAVGVAVLAAIAAGKGTIAAGDHAAFIAAAMIAAGLASLAATVVPSIKPQPGTNVAIH